MLMFDVNVLVHAFRPDAERHQDYKRWPEEEVASPEAFGIPELAFSGSCGS